jgi:hypothetical protein
MNRLEAALARIAEALTARGQRWCMVGGMAVSARAEPRTTRDVDVAVDVAHDAEAEQLIFDLQEAGYRPSMVLEQAETKRLSTVRLRELGASARAPVVDVLFASTGVEPEIVAAADRLEVLPRLVLPVATVGHLIAMKPLARDDETRPHDRGDLLALSAVASPADRQAARELVALMTARGTNRGRDLVAAWENLPR